MGREIRKVIPNWDHPKSIRPNGDYNFKPLNKGSYQDALAKWFKAHLEWEKGIKTYPGYSCYAAFWGDPPSVEEKDDYMPHWSPEEATWFQVYETVSEGTPVTPPFETREELVKYLMQNGDFWDQKRREDPRCRKMNCEPWTQKQAEAFVFGAGWAPSFIGTSQGIMDGARAIGDLQ